MAGRKNIPARRKSEPRPERSTAPELAAIRLQLETVYSVVATVVSALDGNNADRDPDFATCLTRCALTPLAAVIARLEGTGGEKAVPA